tara:strand:+ start:1692 stop:2423 length:732 start_codon:yes stop_codon:yes gene_type:complete
MQATIYQIKSDRFEFDSYVGSTKNFKRRRSQHKHSCNNDNNKHHNLHVYKFIRANGGWDDWEMVKLFHVTVKDRKELDKIERQSVEDWGATLNSNVPSQTRKQYYQANAVAIKIKHKAYYETNREKIKVKKKLYREKNKDCCKEYLKQYHKQYHEKHKDRIRAQKKVYVETNRAIIKEKQKAYHEKNREVIIAKHKVYREKNKNKIRAHNSQKIQCECGSVVTRCKLSRHRRSLKHQNFINDV